VGRQGPTLRRFVCASVCRSGLIESAVVARGCRIDYDETRESSDSSSSSSFRCSALQAAKRLRSAARIGMAEARCREGACELRELRIYRKPHDTLVFVQPKRSLDLRRGVFVRDEAARLSVSPGRREAVDDKVNIVIVIEPHLAPSGTITVREPGTVVGAGTQIPHDETRVPTQPRPNVSRHV